MNVVSINGGDGDLPMPNWSEIFTDELLIARAVEVWRGAIAEMRDASTLAPINANQIKRYVIACVVYDQATTQVAENSPVVPAKRSRSASWNPWWTVLKDADTMATNHEDKLGLSPRRRAQVAPAKRKPRAVAAADRYLAAQG